MYKRHGKVIAMGALYNKLRSNKKLFDYLELIKKKAEDVHKDRVLIDFTDHGIAHSERMINMLDSLGKNSIFNNKKTPSINETEAFILLAAIYLHDIGMQISEESKLEGFAKEKGIKYNKSDKNEFVRKNHHLLSGYWIECNIKSVDELPKVYVGDGELGKLVQLVVESHGIDFIHKEEYDKEFFYKGQEIRLKILCILLSLADALDCDCRRVDIEKVMYTEIDDFSQIHWWKHYYVNSVSIRNNIVEIYYCFPKAGEHEKQIYKYFFSHQSTFWIKKNKEEYSKYLSEFGIVFDIREHFIESETKKELSKKMYVKVEDKLVDILDNFYSDNAPISVANFRVTIGILKKDGQVLLVKRKKPEGTLIWQFPAGIIKPAEKAEERVVKEFLGETGITVEVEQLLGKRIHPNTKAVSYYFSLRYIAGDARNGDMDENDEVKWVPIEDYKGLITSDLYINIEKYLADNP